MIEQKVRQALEDQPAVALLGPRQVGKTTLALEIARKSDALYLDLERANDRNKLQNPESFLEYYEDRLVILDEIHRAPELFRELRGIIDRGRRKGKEVGRFLLLGSASINLLRQSGETLAGRVAFIDMSPLHILEVPAQGHAPADLWLRGGYPRSYCATNDAQSLRWRTDLIRTCMNRDVLEFEPRLSPVVLERLWTMLAHDQGSLLNSSKLAGALGTSAQTVTRYLSVLVDLLLVRRLPPFYASAGKRLVKSPKIYLRDSGLVHALLGLGDHNAVVGHSVVGMSWEGFVIESLIAAAPTGTLASFYRTSAGAEADLVLELPGRRKPWAIDIKRSPSAAPLKGFYNCLEDLAPEQAFAVHSGADDRHPMSTGVEAIGLRKMAETLAAQAD